MFSWGKVMVAIVLIKVLYHARFIVIAVGYCHVTKITCVVSYYEFFKENECVYFKEKCLKTKPECRVLKNVTQLSLQQKQNICI